MKCASNAFGIIWNYVLFKCQGQRSRVLRPVERTF